MNMKELYVINLNMKRVLLLSGIFFILLGTILWLGLSIGNTRSNSFAYQDNFASIAKEMGISDKELKGLNLSEASPHLESLPLQMESKKVAPIQNLIKPQKDTAFDLSIRDHDPLSSVKQKEIKQPSNKTKDKVFSIQVAAFKKEKHAIVLLKQMQAAGFSNARIDRGIRYYYVRMGHSFNKQNLASKNAQVKKLFNIKTLIIRKNS